MTSRKKKIYTAVVLVAFAALVIDQLSRGPGNASAEQPGVIESITSTADGGSPALANPDSDKQVQAATFPGPFTISDAVMRDPFALPDILFAEELQETSEPDPVEQHEAIVQRVSDFESAHRLSSIIRLGSDSIAIVDGTIIRVGESVNDWTLERVEGQSAYFTHNGKIATLSVLQDANSLPVEAKAPVEK